MFTARTEHTRRLKRKVVVAGSKALAFAEAWGIVGMYLKDRVWRFRPKVQRRRVRPGDSLRVAIVTEYYYPVLGGVTEHVHHFAAQLLAMGHEPTIVTAEAGPFGRDVGPVGSRVVKVGRSVPIYSNDSYARVAFGWDLDHTLGRVLEEGDFDIVHVHSPITPTLPLLAIKQSPVPVVGTFHTHFDSSGWLTVFKEGVRLFMDAMALRIAVSPVCVRSVAKFYPGYAYRVIPNGVNTEWFHPDAPRRPDLQDGAFNILYVGRFDPRNGLDVLLDAFENLSRRHDHLRLVIMGYGPLEDYYRSRVPAWLEDRVVFTGRVDEERPGYFASADVLCLPAKKGSFGITLVEAMSTGVPVVTTDIEGFRFVMTHGKQGLMVPEEAGAAGFEQALETLIGNPDLRLEMAAQARKRALDFSWEKVAQAVVAEYYRLLGAEAGCQESAWNEAAVVAF